MHAILYYLQESTAQIILNTVDYIYTLGPPNITFYSSGIISFEGEKVIIVCNATNDEDAVNFVQISWYNRTRLLKSDGKFVTIDSKCSSDSDQIQSVLVLDSVNNTDSGEYVCRAFNNPLCYSEEKIKLTVECKFVYSIMCNLKECAYLHIYILVQ